MPFLLLTASFFCSERPWPVINMARGGDISPKSAACVRRRAAQSSGIERSVGMAGDLIRLSSFGMIVKEQEVPVCIVPDHSIVNMT